MERPACRIVVRDDSTFRKYPKRDWPPFPHQEPIKLWRARDLKGSSSGGGSAAASLKSRDANLASKPVAILRHPDKMSFVVDVRELPPKSNP